MVSEQTNMRCPVCSSMDYIELWDTYDDFIYYQCEGCGEEWYDIINSSQLADYIETGDQDG